jgi:hypothetical protein
MLYQVRKRRNPGGPATSPIAKEVLIALFPDQAGGAAPRLWEALAQGQEALVAQLRRESLTPLIYLELIHQGRQEEVDPVSLHQLQNDFAHSLNAAALQEQEIWRLIEAFSQAEVDFILIKGADLRLRVYRDPAQRPMSDLDILVSPAQHPQAREVLVGLGYFLSPYCNDPRPGFRELFDHELEFDPPQGRTLPVDLHWETRAVAGFYRLPYAALQPQAISLIYQGLPLRFLAPEHALLHLCLHAFNDFYETGRVRYTTLHLVDIAMALTRMHFDWPRFLQEVARCGCQRPVSSVLGELAEILPLALPPFVLAELRGYRLTWGEMIMMPYGLGYLTNYFPVFYHHPLRDWLRFLEAKLRPDPDYLANLADKPNRPSYWRQFIQKLSCLIKV